jgi:hypothetical protein
MSGASTPNSPPSAANPLDGGSATPIPNSRCVLWLHNNEVVPKPLLRSLSRRIERTVFATDAYQALAEVCALTREGQREGRPSPIVLLLIKPLRLADADQVLHYLDMYAPKTRRWRFDPSAAPIFAPMSEEDVAKLNRAGVRTSQGSETETARPEIVVPANAGRKLSPAQAPGAPMFPNLAGSGGTSGLGGKLRPSPKPRLRLVEADPSAETIVGSTGPGGTSFAQLTPEELQMLLSDPPSGGGNKPGSGGSKGNRS